MSNATRDVFEAVWQETERRSLFGDAPDVEGAVREYAADYDENPEDLETLVTIRSMAAERVRSARAVLDGVEAMISAQVGAGAKWRSGPEFFQVKPTSTFRIVPERRAEFWDAVEDLAAMSHLTREPEYRTALEALFNPNQVRKTGLKAATDAGVELADLDPETGEISTRTLWSLFETVDDGTPTLVSMPVNKAPKYVAALPELSVRYGRGPGKTTRPEEETTE